MTHDGSDEHRAVPEAPDGAATSQTAQRVALRVSLVVIVALAALGGRSVLGGSVSHWM